MWKWRSRRGKNIKSLKSSLNILFSFFFIFFFDEMCLYLVSITTTDVVLLFNVHNFSGEEKKWNWIEKGKSLK